MSDGGSASTIPQATSREAARSARNGTIVVIGGAMERCASGRELS